LGGYRSVLVASRHMRREFAMQGVLAERLHRVPLPIPGVDGANAARPIRSEPDSILFAGRLVDAKGVGYLLRAIPVAARKLGRRLTLTIAGDGPKRAALERQAAETGVDARFLGWLESEKTMEQMRQADLLAVPSLWPEPFGLVGIEAGRFALPAVGYAVGGIPDWLIGGQTGEIAPGDPPTVEGLASAIVRALGARDHYQRLCGGARELSQEFTMERHVAQLESLLEGSAAKKDPEFSVAQAEIAGGGVARL
jgi:glycosyltransferase involved in cell wall biosynthesis